MVKSSRRFKSEVEPLFKEMLSAIETALAAKVETVRNCLMRTATHQAIFIFQPRFFPLPWEIFA